MKKGLVLGISAIALLSLSGCGSSKADSSKAVADRELLHVGEYHPADSTTPKSSLLSITKPSITKSIEGATYSIQDVKYLKLVSTTDKQLNDDETNWGEDLTKTYYEVQVDYSVKNTSDNKIMLGSGAELILTDGTQVSTNQGAMDSLISSTIQPNAKKSGFISAKVPSDYKSSLSKIKLVTSTIADKDGMNLSENTETINLK